MGFDSRSIKSNLQNSNLSHLHCNLSTKNLLQRSIMKKQLKIILSITAIGLFGGCVPVPKPQIGIGIGGVIGQTNQTNQNSSTTQPIKAPIEPVKQVEVVDKEYGAKPLNYTTSIRRYFSAKIARGDLSTYKYGVPKRAYKRKGFAYGGNVAWKGWLVETSIATPTRTGRLLTPKPYMVLFSGEQIVEHILGSSHKLITKVDK